MWLLHHGPPVESDCEALSEVDETTLDPVSSMIEVAACERILTAQPGATDTPTDAVIEARFAGPDGHGAGIAHDMSIPHWWVK